MAHFPSLYPLFMLNPFAGGGVGGGEIVVTLNAQPEVVLEEEVQVTVDTSTIEVTLEQEIEVEVE